jgi:Protein of unknown function (DUF2798)
MEGKARIIFPIVMTGIIVFFVSAVVTFLNIGMRADFLTQWMRSFGIGWPIAAFVGFFAMPVARSVTERLLSWIEKAP